MTNTTLEEIDSWKYVTEHKKKRIKEIIKAEIASALTCGKYVEEGKAICGVKLDCHLHDWRQKEQIATALKTQKYELRILVESFDPDGININHEEDNYYAGKRHVITDILKEM